MLNRPSGRAFGNGLAVLLLLALAAGLGACSSDGTPATAASASASSDGGAGSSSGSIVTPAAANADGLWWGKLSRDGEAVNSVSCLLTVTGEIACLLYEDDPAIVIAPDPVVGNYGVPPVPTGGASGTLQLADTSDLSGSGVLYAAPGAVLFDQSSTVAPFEITGGRVTALASTRENPYQRQLELTISSLGKVSTLRAESDHYYFLELNGGVQQDRITGVYVTFAIFDDPASLAIDADGAFVSQSASGCLLSGHIGIIHPAFNGYAVNVTVDNCADQTGAYAGLAFLNDFIWVNGTDNLRIVVFNDTGFLAGEARKY